MGKRILVVCTILLIGSNICGQDYALWTSTKPYQFNLEGYNYSASYTKVDDAWFLSNPDPGIYTNIPETPIKAVATEFQSIWILNGYDKLCVGGGVNDLNKFEQFVFGHNGEIQLCYDIISDNPDDYSTVWQYAVILPNYVQPDENNRKHEDLLFKTNQNNFPDQPVNIPGVEWKYSVDDNFSFKHFPDDILHQFPMKATVGEILAQEPNANAVQNLRVKIFMDIPNSNIPQLSSEILLFTVELSSPELLDIVPTSTTCPNSNDGGFTMILDRDLDGEKLVVSVYDVNNDTEILNQDDTTSLLDNGDDTFSFVWVKPLAPGDYMVKYQTLPKNLEEQPLWNSLEFSPEFTIGSPDPVTYTLGGTNVKCHGGSDGSITVSPSGGSGNNYQYTLDGGDWTDLPNDNTIKGLPKGDYTIALRDGNACTGTPNGPDEVAIGEPAAPVSIALEGQVEPLGFGFTNGSITAMVTGGTPLNDNSYNYQWTDAQDNPINTVTTEEVNSGYQITLNDIGAGTYTLTIWDANHEDATTKGGCTDVMDFVLTEPPPLAVNIQKTNPVSCNSTNNFNNPSDDGELTAIASGGVPFDPLIDGFYPYYYIWKKKDDQEVWQTIPDTNGNVLANVGAGEYAVNIKDANGITIGTYVNNVLQQAKDHEYTMDEPEALSVALDKTDVNCWGGSDGTASVTIEGGNPPYDIFWSTGESTPTIEDLSAGNYVVYVMDAKGCEASGQVIIDQLGTLEIQTISKEPPTCNDSQDGSITLEVTGGNPPYTYLWNTGAETTTLSGLGDGTYTFQVTDANGCSKELDMTLESPVPLTLNMAGEKTLCKGQVHELDITMAHPGATYQWSSNNGFNSSSPKVTLSEAGSYTATITTGEGCTGSGTINIITSETTMDSEFLVTSQAFAGEEIVLVNTSNPPGTGEEWIFPEGVTVKEQGQGLVVIRFEQPGAYEVTLRNYEGDCYADFTKNIIVDQARELPDVGDAPSPFIHTYTVHPNPSTGSFRANVSLGEAAAISLRLYSLTSNQPYDDRELQGQMEYEVDYEMDLSSGVYLLLLETPKERQIRKIVIF